MGRGRKPCCDKNRMNKGPWSPAEDRKLIAFVNKYGHDNWRSVPRQAGLLRCGKSCRLRWVNYLRPNIKRGNYSPEEEDTIIQLHQILGNKWSQIASYLPGRTDNEIKNVWNTYLKKRLAANAVDDVTKETSVIVSSSLSATDQSNSKCQKSERQIKLLAQEENKMKTDGAGLTQIALATGHQTTVGCNHVTEVNSCESFNKNEPIPQQSEQNLDTCRNYKHEKITIPEDTNESLLELLLNEVDDPNWLQAPANTQTESIANNSSCELNMESDLDFWSMLDNDAILASAKPDQNKADNIHTVEAPMSKKFIITPYEYADDKDISSMFMYLENQAELAQQSVRVIENQKQRQKDYVNTSFSAAATVTEVNRMPNIPMWPQSPMHLF